MSFVVRARWLVTLVCLAAIAALLAGAPRVSETNDSRVFFGPDNPQRAALEAMEARFTQSNALLFALEARSGDVFSRPALEAIAFVTKELWRAPYVSRVDSLTNYQYSRAEGDDIIIADLARDPATMDEAALARVRTVAMSEPSLKNVVVSADGKIALVAANFILPDGSPHRVDEIMRFVDQIRHALATRTGAVTSHLTGDIAMSVAFGEATRRDMTLLAPAMLGLAAVFLLIMLRSLAATFAILVIALGASAATLGFVGWAGVVLTAGSAPAPTIVLTLAVANSVHLVVSVLYYRRGGMAKIAAVSQALRVNIWPIFLTSTTTAVGFLSMNTSDAPPFADLGNLVAFGVGVSFVSAVVLLPALLALLPIKAVMPPGAQGGVAEKVGRFVVRRRRVLTGSILGLAAVLALGASRIELNDDWIANFDNSYAFRRDTEAVLAHGLSVEVIDYMLDSGKQGGVNDPAFLATADAFVAWARARPEVVAVTSVTDILKRLNKNMNDDDPAFYRLPGSADLAAQYFLLYEMSLPPGLDLNDRVDIGKSALRVSVATARMTSREMRAFDARASWWLREVAASPGTPPAGAGVPVMFAHMSKRNIQSMLLSTGIAFVAVSLLLVIALRSLWIGLLSLVPNVLPAMMAFGLWGLLVGEMGVAISVVAAITFGIVVDDTIHFLSKYLYARRQLGLSPDEAVVNSFRSVGRALLTTTVVLVAGFLVFTFSGFRVTWGMGVLASITLTFALICDFFLLPPLLLALDCKKDAATHP